MCVCVWGGGGGGGNGKVYFSQGLNEKGKLKMPLFFSYSQKSK